MRSGTGHNQFLVGQAHRHAQTVSAPHWLIIEPYGRSGLYLEVSFQVSVKMILADIYYDSEAPRERQVIEYMQEENGPMLFKTGVRWLRHLG